MKLDLDEPEDKISRESDEGSMTSGSISGSTFSGSQILTGSNFSGQILSGTSDSPANGDVSALKRQKQELEIKLREEVSERSVQKKLIQYGRGWGESNNEKGTQDYYNKAFCQKIKFLFIYLSYYLSKLSSFDTALKENFNDTSNPFGTPWYHTLTHVCIAELVI
jgi:hypothetical protein